MFDFAAAFDRALPYDAFLAKHGSEEQQRRWREMLQRIQLTDQQRQLLSGFRREIKVLCLAGAWCGDCVQQCPIFEHFAVAAPSIQVRYVDRDADDALKTELSVCGGARVPVVVFLSEDGQHVGRYGDRTLSKYRQMAADQLGPSCPTGIAPPAELLVAVTQDWLNEFERVQLILRTSPRLRAKHRD